MALKSSTLVVSESFTIKKADRGMELCLSREMVFEKLNFYYAFGNTPPTYVLPGVARDADALLLASGDLRSALFSLKSDAAGRYPVRFTVNDADKHVIARNVILLWLLCLRSGSHSV